MSEWQLLDDGNFNGVRKYIRSGDDPDSVQVRYEGHDQSLLEANKASQNDGFDKSSEFWHAASIPVSVMYDWLVNHGVNAWDYAKCPDTRKAVNRLLNSSDYRYLRVNHFIM